MTNNGRRQRGSVLGRLVFLGLIVFGVWYFYVKWWPKNNFEHFDGRLNSAITRELTHQGVTDKDVLSQVRKEHSLRFLRWVETSRTIQVSSSDRAQDVSKGLQDVSEHLGCSIDQQQTPSGQEITIKRYFWVMQRILLVISTPLQTPQKMQKGPRVAFVIDDVAYETASMDHFATLGVPLTFAILPRERHSKELSAKAIGMNFPVMLHLPMEPLDVVHNDPGPTGMYLKMSDAELKKQFDRNVASVPNIVGINNHMGSAFTENEAKMALVMEWVKKRGVYFLDSRTTGHSVVCKEAKRFGVPCLANETFLDNSDDVKSIEKQLDLVMKLAVKEGQTIAIGHYRRKFLVQALADKLPEFKSRGIEVVTLPTLYRR